MNEYDFANKLAFSRDRAAATDADTIRKIIPGCVSVEAAPVALDRRGIDYIATLRRGATLNIDLKAREPGCSRYWKSHPLFGSTDPEPELALEIYSVRPAGDGSGGVVGWTLDESKLTDYTLHVFDPSDSTEVFLLPFQLLRMAFQHCLTGWRQAYSKPNGRDIQTSTRNGRGWQSECVFVPAWCVIESVTSEMRIAGRSVDKADAGR